MAQVLLQSSNEANYDPANTTDSDLDLEQQQTGAGKTCTSCMDNCKVTVRRLIMAFKSNDYFMFLNMLMSTSLYYVDIFTSFDLAHTYYRGDHPWYCFITVSVFILAKQLGSTMTDYDAIPLGKHQLIADLGHNCLTEVVLPVRVVVRMINAFRSKERQQAMMKKEWETEDIYASAHRLAEMKTFNLRLAGTSRCNAMIRSPVQIVLNIFIMLHGDYHDNIFIWLLNTAISLFSLAKEYAFTDKEGSIVRHRQSIPVVVGQAPMIVVGFLGIIRTIEVIANLGTFAIFHEVITVAFVSIPHVAVFVKFGVMVFLRLVLCKLCTGQFQISQVLMNVAGLNAPIVSLPITVCSMYAPPLAHFGLQVLEAGACWSAILEVCSGFEVDKCTNGSSPLSRPIFVCVAACQVLFPILLLSARCLLRCGLPEEPPKAVGLGLATLVARDGDALPAELLKERPVLHAYGLAAAHDEAIAKVEMGLNVTYRWTEQGARQHAKYGLGNDTKAGAEVNTEALIEKGFDLDNLLYEREIQGEYEVDPNDFHPDHFAHCNSVAKAEHEASVHFQGFQAIEAAIEALPGCALPELEAVFFSNGGIAAEGALDRWNVAASAPGLRFFGIGNSCGFVREEHSFHSLLTKLPETVEVLSVDKRSVPTARVLGRSLCKIPGLKEIRCEHYSLEDVAELLAGLHTHPGPMPRIVIRDLDGSTVQAEELLGPSHSELAKVQRWQLHHWKHQCDFLSFSPEATFLNLSVDVDLTSAAAGTRLGRWLPPGLEELQIDNCGARLEAVEALAVAEPGLRRLRRLTANNNAGLLAAPGDGKRLGKALPCTLEYLEVYHCSGTEYSAYGELDELLPKSARIICDR
eukprot:TRINITY_DN16003_c0_g1_i1.p1 TRINITY_DN16003_c0_g1~~TRINITY_DN16003_c0_g1_i1.p1  ORF type:complete len:859 (+),score=137.72 TRINITY_DN16003_c0_g1_i1:89-2665(+)